mmetsp:Transcript_44928/g.97773  ORF Transcript_44928/g.97773 Transcript_44928/m.97773 type:complete len:85 (+) Transcript_44928:395-649(+)
MKLPGGTHSKFWLKLYPVVRPEQAEVAYCLRYGTTLPPTTMPGVCGHPGKPAKLYTGSRHSEGQGGPEVWSQQWDTQLEDHPAE